jgi:hypothetical protein
MSDKKIWGSLLHLGKNMWSDKPYPRPVQEVGQYNIPSDLPPEILKLKKLWRTNGGYHDRLRFDE